MVKRKTMALRVVFALLCVQHASCAFSISTSFDGGIIQQNGQKTWCYYPAAGQTTALSCGEDYSSILAVHLKQEIAIGYYGPDGGRYGGAEWPVPLTNPGKIFLCGSGRVGDGSYQTFCGAPVTADNSIPGPFGRTSGDCLVATAQQTVTDGCYVPAQAAVAPPSTPVATTIETATSSPETTDLSTTALPDPSTPPTTSNQPTSSTSATTGAGASSGGNGLSTSDKIAIGFGVVTALGVVFGILKWSWSRNHRA